MALAIASVLICFAVKSVLVDTPFLLMTVAIAVSAWREGLRPGLLAALLSTILVCLSSPSVSPLACILFLIQSTGLVLLITELQRSHLQASKQLEQMAELQQLNLLKDDLLGMVAHELQRPIGNIKMLLAVVFKVPVQNQERYIQGIKHECDHSIALIKDLLDLHTLEKGRALNEWVDRDWLLEVINPYAERAKLSGLWFNAKVENLPKLRTDPRLLERVVTELLHNAIKYTPVGEMIRLAVIPAAEGWAISVSNSGVEIPESELGKVFERFYRIPGSDRNKQGGTGLGLTIVAELVKVLRGQLSVESSGGMTEFSVLLPSS